MSGAIVTCAGFMLATLSPNVPVLILTYGLIGGLGFGLVGLPSKVAIGYYFETKRALATGIAECGTGVGTFVYISLFTYLVKHTNSGGEPIICPEDLHFEGKHSFRFCG